MKRTFTLITILISFSLVGLIFIQVSWLKNMVKVREEAIKEKVDRAVRTVGEELVKYKEIYLNNQINSLASPFQEDQSIEILRPLTIGSRFTTVELHDKIRAAFDRVDLVHMKFEFLLTAGSLRSNTPDQMERISKNYDDEREDTLKNFSKNLSLVVPSGSDSENLSKDESLYVLAIDYKQFAVKSLRMPIAIAILFTIIIITAFYLTVRTMLRQKKLGEIKNDFINNMTHEFKTPIATISLAVDAMKNEKVLQDREKITYFSSIIKEENQRMNRQVETILKASQLERQEVDLNLQPLHAHKVIKDVVDNFILQLEGKHANAELSLIASQDVIDADEVHFSNLINNLVDNAIKYSKDNTPLQLKVSSTSDEKKFYVKVEDNGIGMNKETVKRVFERFYRAHTGNIHNVKGFGLGLSYVKTMVEAHHGDIKAESTLGKGSCFTVEFPLKKV